MDRLRALLQRPAVRRLEQRAAQHLLSAVPATDVRRDELLRLEVAVALQAHGQDGLLRTDTPMAVRQQVVAEHLADRGLLGRAPWVAADVVEAETAVGRLLLPGHDRFITPPLVSHGVWEPAESAFLEANVAAGDIVVDVGAHVGYHSLRLARRVGGQGRLIAFEASPTNFSLLCANLDRNGVPQALPVFAAVAATSGTAEFTLSVDSTGGNRAYRLSYVEPNLTVPAVALDDIWPTDVPLHLVKVDVEGMDHLAIQGMQRMIDRWQADHPDRVLTIPHRDGRRQSHWVVEFYQQVGYQLEVLQDDGTCRISGRAVGGVREAG